ncbi:pullulanase-type alpha-1,6-glucosidase [Marinibactrum halimedae]|uniref:pullulanase n=1 Tax=Marinibactrum halimedae TaxID=1444977 RepID=A0AA37TBV7_9GAMM|nr:pullulanase-type alpha-1,6-glucosidase [Marinibactrum halimedae]MCD9457928.1 pullulanase-type alpha-1,6-glucosidase [Marinibactrum halimedae]GLS26247.1 pullulanase [Marinibactrum halimedae]
MGVLKRIVVRFSKFPFLKDGLLKKIILSLLLLGVVSCGGSGNDTESGSTLFTCNQPLVISESGNSCVEPPSLECPTPLVPDADNVMCIPAVDPTLPEPSIQPGDNQAVLYYNRGDGVYDNWKLHIWNDNGAPCDAYSDEQLNGVDWNNGVVHSGVDPNYGAYWILALKDGFSECANFIIHDADEKENCGQDKRLFLTGERMTFALQEVCDVYNTPILSLGVSVAGASAIWVSENTLLWDAPTDAAQYRLHVSSDAGLNFDSEAGVTNGRVTSLAPVEFTSELTSQFPHLSSYTPFSHNENRNWVTAALKGELIAVAYDANNAPIAATRVQIAEVLDDVFTSGDNDANEATLGIQYENIGDSAQRNISAQLWAPTAQQVRIKIFSSDKTLLDTQAMTLDEATGIWRATGSNWDRQFYRYEVTAFHPASNAIEVMETTDPYSVSLSTNGEYSQFVNLSDTELKPIGWDTHNIPTLDAWEDAIIYEGHVRDFSIWDESTSVDNRGKYLAFTETNSVPMQHLQSLVNNGLNVLHLLPTNDITTVNERGAERVDLTDTVEKLCSLNNAAPVCGVENGSSILRDVLASYDPASTDAQALVNSLRGLDGFNWGYDPHHFGTPEGSYATDPDGVARIIEMRAMIQSLHQMGLRVISDVVYNHTASSGLNPNSVLDKVVPGYYHRLNETSGAVENSTCCDNTAPERVMMSKLMTDTLVIWAQHYKFDGFRFDVMGHIPKSEILAAQAAVLAVDSDNHFYGEGWNFGDDVRDGKRFEQATQANMAGTEISTFNDRIRESVRSADLFMENGSLLEQDFIRISMAGTLKDYIFQDQNGLSVRADSVFWNSQPAGYGEDPADIMNYVSKHDNETLWDILQTNLPSSESLESRVRLQNIAIAIPLVSQGIPFLQFGGDFLRSKSLDRNTYDAGEWFNDVDFTLNSSNWNIGLPLAQDNESKWDNMRALIANPQSQPQPSHLQFASQAFQEFLSIRSNSALFRLQNKEEVLARIGFHNTGTRQTQGVIVMSIDDGIGLLDAGLTDIDPNYDALVVVVNGTAQSQSHRIPTAQGFSLHPVLASSVDATVRTSTFTYDASTNSGEFTVPAQTMAVFVKAQGATQGEGLAADATSGEPDVAPFGGTTVFIRGSMNDWGEVDILEYQSAGIYRLERTLTTGDYEFKVASSDWSTVDLGGSGSAVVLGTPQNLISAGSNIPLSIAQDGQYVFTVDALDINNPTITVNEKVPFDATTIYVRGSLNGWSTDNPMTYSGNNLYTTSMSLAVGDYEFKIASEDWTTVDFGGNGTDNAVVLDTPKTLTAVGANLTLTISVAGNYQFFINAADSANPNVTIRAVP